MRSEHIIALTIYAPQEHSKKGGQREQSRNFKTPPERSRFPSSSLIMFIANRDETSTGGAAVRPGVCGPHPD